jgi:hypothetical protein
VKIRFERKVSARLEKRIFTSIFPRRIVFRRNMGFFKSLPTRKDCRDFLEASRNMDVSEEENKPEKKRRKIEKKSSSKLPFQSFKNVFF